MTQGPLVIALGGNALSPPAGDASIAAERTRVTSATVVPVPSRASSASATR